MSELTIRPLRATAEARTCAAFMAASEPWLTLQYPEERVFQRLTDPAREVHIAEMENQIVGALMLCLSGPLSGYIQTIAVHPAWRGRGLGTQLMRFAEEKIFRKSPNVFLCVTAFNHGAQKFYERLGYQKVGALENYLQHGHTEILMRKTKGPLLSFQPEI
jgi:ribosomal protein S18 acetylase RimI-like enzyme